MPYFPPQQWENFKKTYNKAYLDASEEERRNAIWIRNTVLIE